MTEFWMGVAWGFTGGMVVLAYVVRRQNRLLDDVAAQLIKIAKMAKDAQILLNEAHPQDAPYKPCGSDDCPICRGRA